MKTTVLRAALVLLLVTALPAFAGSRYSPYEGENSFRFQFGMFTPDGESTYWHDKALDFSGSVDDFEDTSFVVDYNRYLNSRTAITLSAFVFEGDAAQSYLDFVDQFGSVIQHTTLLELTSVSLGLRFNLANRDAVIVPYVGAGGGIYSWRLEEFGDFIDFVPPPAIVITDSFYAEGDAFGYHLLAGIDVPITPSWAIFAEGRWQWADDDLGGDFEGLGTLDLGGQHLAAGMSWSF